MNLAAATFAPYWNQIVMPVAASGYRPQLADGYGRFLHAPEIANAASVVLEKQLATNATNPMDSHPPLKARIEKARALGIATATEDNRTAVTLFEDLPWLELQLLTKLIPALKPSELKPMNMIRKGRVRWLASGDVVGQAHFIGELFGLST